MVANRILSTYQRILRTHTYKVQIVQTSALLALGDVISQNVIEGGEKKFDYTRTLRFTAVGFAIGPILQKWYTILDKIIGKQQNFKTAMKKVTLDQLCFSPIFIAFFISAVGLLEGKKIDEIKMQFKTGYTDILINNYKLWPIVQVINFSIMPLNFRVVYVQIVAIGWNTYLAWKINNDMKNKAKNNLALVDNH